MLPSDMKISMVGLWNVCSIGDQGEEGAVFRVDGEQEGLYDALRKTVDKTEQEENESESVPCNACDQCPKI